MSKLHLKYVQSFGGYHYFRRAGMPRVALPGIPGSREFLDAYRPRLLLRPPRSAPPCAVSPDPSPLRSPSTTSRRHSGL
jgi:hypothetical protein